MQHDETLLIQMYRDLLEVRMLEQRLVELYAQGIVPGHIHSGVGQEATYAGILATRKQGDYFKILHRPVSSSHILGVTMDTFFGEILAKKTGNAGGRGGVNHVAQLEHGILGLSASQGCDTGVAVGAALTIQMEKRDNIAYCFFGDGCSNRGPVHEAMALAASWHLPVLFVCDNNQFAISTPVSFASPTENIFADRAAGYGMPCAIVDGTNVVEIYEAAEKLVNGIRQGGGPAMMEVKNYRWRGHFEGDQCPYRDGSVAKERMETNDCVAWMENYLSERGILGEKDFADMRETFSQERPAAIARAEAAPPMDAGEMFDLILA